MYSRSQLITSRIILSQLEVIAAITHIITSGLVKLSVLFFYHRIFVIDTHWKDGRNLCISSLIVLVSLWTIIYTFTYAFACGTHFQALWKPETANDFDKYCVDTTTIGFSIAISAFISDATVLLVPIRFVSGLTTNRTTLNHPRSSKCVCPLGRRWLS